MMYNKKLYVWEGVLTDYTDGIMFAIAENPLKARLAVFACEVAKLGSEEYKDYKRYLQKKISQADFEEKYGWCSIVRDLENTPDVYSDTVGFAVCGGS